MEISKINEISINEIFKDKSDFRKWFETEEVKKEFEKLIGMELEDTEEFRENNPDFSCLHAYDTRYSFSALFFINYCSDHKKAIGNLVTCACVGFGSSIVWITDKATNDDWWVIDMLNRHSDGCLMFYLVELHFYSIEGSNPAYQLRVVYEPKESDMVERKMKARREYLEGLNELNEEDIKMDL